MRTQAIQTTLVVVLAAGDCGVAALPAESGLRARNIQARAPPASTDLEMQNLGRHPGNNGGGQQRHGDHHQTGGSNNEESPVGPGPALTEAQWQELQQSLGLPQLDPNADPTARREAEQTRPPVPSTWEAWKGWCRKHKMLLAGVATCAFFFGGVTGSVAMIANQSHSKVGPATSSSAVASATPHAPPTANIPPVAPNQNPGNPGQGKF